MFYHLSKIASLVMIGEHMMDQLTMQRLGLIRYIYNNAMEESKQPEPFRAVSILRFHDSVELFLDLICDKFGISAKATYQFNDYWNAIGNHLQQGQSLSQKRAIDRLSMARAGFKHHGNMSSTSDIEKFRVNVTDFFEENTPLIFGIDFSEVSMSYLIKNDEVRITLEKASKLIEGGDKETAIEKIAIAFAQLLEDFESKTRTDFGKSLFSFDHSLAGIMPIGSDDETVADLASEVESFASDVESAIADMQNALKILALGLDYRRYVRFKLLTPTAKRFSNGNYKVHPNLSKVETLTLDHCRFCYDFVIESAIELQTVDLQVKVVTTYQNLKIDESILKELFSNSDSNID